MNHKKIQKQFLLYNDGDLSPKEKSLFDQHISECADCRTLFHEVSEIWRLESNIEKLVPSPTLWYKLKNRIEKTEAQPFVISKLVNAKLFVSSALKFGVVALSIFIGARFGYLISPQSSTSNNSHAQIENIRDEFGLSYFNPVPPGSLAKDILITEIDQRGSE